MSYANISPGYYQMLQPNSVWHPGGPGWSTAPVPGWGENPNLVGPARLAVSGLGGCSSCSGLGGVKAFSGLGAESQGALTTVKYIALGVGGLFAFLAFTGALAADTSRRERKARYRSAAARYRQRTIQRSSR